MYTQPRLIILLVALSGCSAPDTAPPDASPPPEGDATGATTPPAPPTSPDDRPPTDEDIAAASSDDSEPAPPPAAPAEAEADPATPPPPPGEAPPPEAADPSAAWTDAPASAPFTAWTRTAGLTLLGMGGDTLTTLERAGMRVEVVSVEGEWANVQCRTCAGKWRNAGGWLPLAGVQPAAREVDPADPLSAILAARARWAAGMDLPDEGAGPALCQLADLGYTLSEDDRRAVWKTDDGAQVIAEARDGSWALAAPPALPDAGSASGACAVTSPAGG